LKGFQPHFFCLYEPGAVWPRGMQWSVYLLAVCTLFCIWPYRLYIARITQGITFRLRKIAH